jgi:hypothetical protein
VALGNTPTRETNFAVEASKSYAFGISFRDKDDDPVSLEGAEVRMVIARETYHGGGVVLEKKAVLIVPLEGLCQFQFQAEELAITPGQYVYDITFVSSSNFSTPILKGYFEVGYNVDYDSSNVYGDVNSGSDITAVVSNGDLIELTIEKIDGMYHVINELIKNFRQDMTNEVKVAVEAGKAAVNAAMAANADANELRAMLVMAGYPFWRVLTQAEYDALPEIANGVLYVIVDPGVSP